MTLTRDIMSTTAGFIVGADSVQTAARAMREHQTTSLAVCGTRGELSGMVDRGDIVSSAAEGLDPVTTAVSRLLKAHAFAPLTVAAEAPIEHALVMMASHQVDQLPVLDAGAWVGTVAHSDIARSLQG